jgi:hypothetical protein
MYAYDTNIFPADVHPEASPNPESCRKQPESCREQAKKPREAEAASNKGQERGRKKKEEVVELELIVGVVVVWGGPLDAHKGRSLDVGTSR